MQFQGFVLEMNFVCRMILSLGFWNIRSFREILEDQDSIVVRFSALWCACISPASEMISARFLSTAALHHNCSLK